MKLSAEEFHSDETWEVSNNNHKYYKAKTDDTIGKQTPNRFSLSKRKIYGTKIINNSIGIVYDFGKEMMSYLSFRKIEQAGEIRVYYGESLEEALDIEHCEQIDVFNVRKGN